MVHADIACVHDVRLGPIINVPAWIKPLGVNEGPNNLLCRSILGEVTVHHMRLVVAHEIAVLVVLAGECINGEALSWYSRHRSVYPMLVYPGLS